jgi:SAM-dependent methyltransferase
MRQKDESTLMRDVAESPAAIAGHSRITAGCDISQSSAGRPAIFDTGGSCRICDHPHLIPVLSLGDLPLANALARNADPGDGDARYPLNLVFCPHCALLQIAESVHPIVLFDEYPYFSSFSDTMLRHARDLAEQLVRTRRLSRENRILEIGSNDGYLLQYFLEKNIPILGIEPAKNLHQVSVQKNIPTLCSFFNQETFRQLNRDRQSFDVILALNVFAHAPDPHEFLEGIRLLLAPDGIAVFEFPYVRELIDKNEFDTIYHEHISYFSVTTLVNLFEQHQLRIYNVERLPIHGGSLRLTVMHNTGTPVSPVVEAFMEEEKRDGLLSPQYYLGFAHSVEKMKRETVTCLGALKREGKKIAGYGAAAKGSTLLNYYGIGRETIDFIADRNPFKQGRYLMGNHIPIVDPAQIRISKPDYILVLPWNLKEEIMEQLSYIRDWEGRFIIPIPKVEMVD